MSAGKRLLILAALLIVSFAVSCGVSLILSPGSPGPTQGGPALATTRPSGPAWDLAMPDAETDRLQPRAKQLEELVRDVRVKLAECRRRELDLDQREKRVRITEGLLKKDAEELESLRVQLVGPLTRLKEAKADLALTVASINALEQKNLKKMAKVYDKMDPESCAQIFLAKCKNQKDEDVANILFYMSERPHAKVLAEMQKADPGAADKVTDRLKRIKQEKA